MSLNMHRQYIRFLFEILKQLDAEKHAYRTLIMCTEPEERRQQLLQEADANAARLCADPDMKQMVSDRWQPAINSVETFLDQKEGMAGLLMALVPGCGKPN